MAVSRVIRRLRAGVHCPCASLWSSISCCSGWSPSTPRASPAGHCGRPPPPSPREHARPPQFTSSGEGPPACFPVCSWLGTVGLVAALVILAAPAWQIIDSGSTPAGVGRMAPMLVAALGIYGANLWLGTALRSANRDESEWIARLLAGPPLFSTFLIAFILCAGVILTSIGSSGSTKERNLSPAASLNAVPYRPSLSCSSSGDC